MPTSRRTRSTKALPFSASRTAEVATAVSRRTPRRSATSRIRASAWIARAIANSSSRFDSAIPEARRGWSFTSSTTLIPLWGSNSATSSRIELDPTSMAPRRSPGWGAFAAREAR